ncbi:MAG: hypothetical protein AAGE03_01610 [Pseudomonadota bacterium]
MSIHLSWSDPVRPDAAPALPYLDHWLWTMGLDPATDPEPCDQPDPTGHRPDSATEREAA